MPPVTINWSDWRSRSSVTLRSRKASLTSRTGICFQSWKASLTLQLGGQRWPTTRIAMFGWIQRRHASSTAGWNGFVNLVQDQALRERLMVAIDGKGAFRRFKDVLLAFPAERERWFAHRSELLHLHIQTWLEHTADPGGESASVGTGDCACGDARGAASHSHRRGPRRDSAASGARPARRNTGGRVAHCDRVSSVPPRTRCGSPARSGRTRGQFRTLLCRRGPRRACRRGRRPRHTWERHRGQIAFRRRRFSRLPRRVFPRPACLRVNPDPARIREKGRDFRRHRPGVTATQVARVRGDHGVEDMSLWRHSSRQTPGAKLRSGSRAKISMRLSTRFL